MRAGFEPAPPTYGIGGTADHLSVTIRQVAAADRLVLTKMDLADEAIVAELLPQVRRKPSGTSRYPTPFPCCGCEGLQA
jgi:hypothetical protein